MISACLQLIDNTAILFAALKSGRPKDSHVNEDPYGEHQKRYKDDRGHKPRSNAVGNRLHFWLGELRALNQCRNLADGVFVWQLLQCDDKAAAPVDCSRMDG
jgi:hypothetical protein